ncbi:MAG: fibronectin type III domain-containing protein [Actinobacteria bacterium]|nr:fibronectin type III domain-containing protein [Actinomycetota bacterium]
MAASAATLALLIGGIAVTGATPVSAAVPSEVAISVVSDSPSITYGDAGPATIGYTTVPVTTADDWTTEPTCAVYALVDTGFTAALSAPYAIGLYVTHCSGGVASAVNLLSYVEGTLTVNKETLYVVPDGKSVTYGDAAPTYTFTFHSTSVDGGVVTPTVDSSPSCGSVYTSSASASLSPVTIECSGGSDSIYSLDTSATGQLTIAKAASSTVVTCTAGPFTYTGLSQRPCSAGVTGAGGLSQSKTPTYANNTNAGSSASASYNYVGDANHNSSSDSTTFTIGKATSSTVVSCTPSVTYTGIAQTPCSVSVWGVGGLSSTPSPTYANNTNAGDPASASYSYVGDANHNSSSDSANFTIGKASSSTVVSCSAGPFTYTGSAQTPCSVDVSGVGGLSSTPSPTYLSNTNAGSSASASYSFGGDANHNSSSDSATFTILKAASSTVVTCTPSVTYTGIAQEPCSVGVEGAALSRSDLPADYVNNTNAGDPASATNNFGGDANHNSSSDSATFTIRKATSSTVVSCLPVTYTSFAVAPCSASVTGAGILPALTFSPTSYSNNINAGSSASVSYNFVGDSNHDSSSDSTTFTIAKATSQTVVSCGRLEFTYTSFAVTPCIATVGGAGWPLPVYVTPTYADNTYVGTNVASATYEYVGDGNHTPSSYIKHFSILKAPSTTVVTCPASVPYTSYAVTPCSVSVTGVGGLALTPTLNPTENYAHNIAVGLNTASARYTFDGDENHSGSTTSKLFSITSAPSVARSVTGSPRIRAVLVSWAAPSSPGGATITGYVATVVGSTKKCTATGSQRSCTVSGLTSGTSYKFTVKATNSVVKSSTSPASGAVIAGAPTDPRSLVASFPAKKWAKVTWVKPSYSNAGAVTGYRVRWCKVGSTCTAWSRQPSSPLVSAIGGRQKNAQYRVELQAKNSSGYGPTASKTFAQTL